MDVLGAERRDTVAAYDLGGEDDRRALAAQLFRALRPGGRLVAVDVGSRALRAGGWRAVVDAARETLGAAGLEVGLAWIVHDGTPQPRLVLEFRKPAAR